MFHRKKVKNQEHEGRTAKTFFVICKIQKQFQNTLALAMESKQHKASNLQFFEQEGSNSTKHMRHSESSKHLSEKACPNSFRRWGASAPSGQF